MPKPPKQTSARSNPAASPKPTGLDGIIGESVPMLEALDRLLRVAPTDATVLLLGESGTGKDLLAARVHKLSARVRGPYVEFPCSAIPAERMEAELFGRQGGAGEGRKRTKGAFERAAGGTLFLDEISELPLSVQVSLLRALEAGRIQRVGAQRDAPIDVRVVAATAVEPALAVREGKLREDLLHHLMVFPIRLPPLRERADDVVLLARHFVTASRKGKAAPPELSAEAADVLCTHPWPGNLRELRQVILRAAVLADGLIEPAHILFPMVEADTPLRPPEGGKRYVEIPVGVTLAEAERMVILETLVHAGNSRRKAAEILKVSPKTLYNKLLSYRQTGTEKD